MTQRLSKFDREFAQEEYEIQRALENAIISLKRGGMTRTSFYNMSVRQGKDMLKMGLGTVKSANEHLNKVMRIWDMEDLR
jgi:hypothetical protein